MPQGGGVRHELKALPHPFAAVVAGEKRHEYRRADRDFREGDTLLLREFVPCPDCNGTQRVWASGDKDDCDCTATPNPGGKYTGREVSVLITYITRCPEWGGPDGFVAMSVTALAAGTQLSGGQG